MLTGSIPKNRRGPRDGRKEEDLVGLYAVTVSTAQWHPYDGYRTRTVVT